MINKKVISTILIIIVVATATVGVILYAQGYRFSQDNPTFSLQETGLLVLTSEPDGAKVFIDGNLATATDDTINLNEGTYDVKIEKDGYFPWQKNIPIKKGVVSEAQVKLFPKTPKLEPITETGAENVIVEPNGRYIAYTVSTGTARERGIYTLDLNSRPIFQIGSTITQLTSDIETPFSTAKLSFSPDGDELLATVSGQLNQPTYLLEPEKPESLAQNVTLLLNQIDTQWKETDQINRQKLISSLPSNLRTHADTLFKKPILSPLENKILYTASTSANLPMIINPPLPGVNPTTEVRELTEGNMYVYDIKEDKNYNIYSVENSQDIAKPEFVWHPNSGYLFFTEENRIKVIQYDGTNKTTISAVPFQENFIYPWPDGSNLIILTNLNLEDAPANLYRISLD